MTGDRPRCRAARWSLHQERRLRALDAQIERLDAEIAAIDAAQLQRRAEYARLSFKIYRDEAHIRDLEEALRPRRPED